LAIILDDCDFDQCATWKGYFTVKQDGANVILSLRVTPDVENASDRMQEWTGSMTLYAEDLGARELQRLANSYRAALMRRASKALGPRTYANGLSYDNQDA
jgi:hypothetical protein